MKKTLQDFNFGTLLRINSEPDYRDKNTMFAVRVQFLTIEITRNKEQLNAAKVSK